MSVNWKVKGWLRCKSQARSRVGDCTKVREAGNMSPGHKVALVGLPQEEARGWFRTADPKKENHTHIASQRGLNLSCTW